MAFLKIPFFVFCLCFCVFSVGESNWNAKAHPSQAPKEKSAQAPANTAVSPIESTKTAPPQTTQHLTNGDPGQQIGHSASIPLIRQPSSNDQAVERNFFETGLEYPLNFGLHFKYFAGPDFYTRLGFGFIPGFFLKSFESLVPSFGILREQEARLISNTLKNSLYTDLRIGWSAYAEESQGGPYLELGLSGIFYGNGNLRGSSLNQALNLSSFEESKTYSIKTRSFNGSVHIGYQIPFEKINLNIELGLIKILYADLLQETGGAVSGSYNLTTEQKNIFKTFLKKKGWIFPTISGWVSFPF